MNSRFIEKLVTHLDRMDPNSVQTQFLRLAKEKGLMETIFNAIQEGILALDDKGLVRYANQATQRFLGWDIKRITGKPIAQFLKDVDWDLILNLDAGEWSRLMRREIEITRPEHRFVEFYAVPLSGEENENPWIVIILRDVTHERQREADTLESEKLNAVMLLAAGVAHEIGNPLNSLNIHLQLLEREIQKLEGEDRQKDLGELVDVAKNEISRLDQIITQFLGALRPSDPQLESALISELLENILAVMKQEIEDRGMWVEVEMADKLPPIHVDKGQIKQAFFNVIKNAMQAMEDGGVLKIETQVSDRFVDVAFVDNGPGMSPEILGHIFEPYLSTKEKGNGLGLMIVQRIMRDHGGFIEIDTREGQGTTVKLFLPREDQRIRLLSAKT